MKELLLSGDRRILAKAITLCESARKDHRLEGMELIESVLDTTGKSFRIGISGPPGVGKSSLIEKLGMKLIAKGHRLAVLPIDPSSPIHKGSILGDKTRMSKLSIAEEAFIRPSPTGGTLGGIAKSTQEAILLCEAAGYDIIIVETVGVGQSEIAAFDMVDTFLMLQLPHAGDELQGIKKGILEIADLIAITKCDGDLAQKAQQSRIEHVNALGLVKIGQKPPEVICISSHTGDGVDDLLATLDALKAANTESGSLAKRREKQRLKWLDKELDQSMVALIKETFELDNELKKIEKKVEKGDSLASLAAFKTISSLESKLSNLTI